MRRPPSSMDALSPALDGPPSEEYAPRAPSMNWRLMRSVALASLVPFFLLSLAHYFSLTLVLVNHLFTGGGPHVFVGGRFFWVTGDERADALIRTVVTIAAISFVLLCLSMVATVSTSAATFSGRRLTMGESLYKMRGLWREPTSVARLYFTILFLGYVLSLVAALVAVTLVVAVCYSLRLGTWLVPLLLSALFLSLYLGVLGSVGLGAFVPQEGGRGVEALWDAVASMEEMKLQGFIIFFLFLVVCHGLFLLGQAFWGRSFFMAGETSQVSLSPFLVSILWMLGTCGLFGYFGVLLQV